MAPLNPLGFFVDMPIGLVISGDTRASVSFLAILNIRVPNLYGILMRRPLG